EADEAHQAVYLAWRCAQDLRTAYRCADLRAGRAMAERILSIFHTCPSPRSPASGGPCGAGRTPSWPTSPPTGPTTAAPRPSVSVEMAGPGPAGQDGSGRADRRVTLEAIGPLLRCSSVELSTLRSAAGTIRPHLGDLIRRLSDPTLRITGS